MKKLQNFNKVASLALTISFIIAAGTYAADRGTINSGETKIGINLAAPSYLDTWTFEGNAGNRVIINAVTTSGNLDTTITLYPPDGGPAEATTAGCPAMNCHGSDQMGHQIAKSGLYTIVISDYSLSNSGTYNINLLKIPGEVLSPQDPNGGPIISGETLDGTINVASDLDAFQFYGDINDRIIINAVNTSGGLDTTITLYPSDSGPAEATTAGCPAMNCHGGDQMNHQLVKAGLYTIVISDYSLNNAGSYNISFLKIPGAASSQTDTNGGPIASGETLSGMINVASDMDAFQFYGDAGKRIIVTAVTTSGNLDTTITLYPPDGGPAETTTAGCPAMNCHGGDLIDHQLAKSGLYTIVISDYSLGQTGNYNISFLYLPPGPVSCPGDLDGGPIASGESLSGTINAASDLDAFQVYGNVNDRVIISAVTTSGNLDTTITLYPPDGGSAEATTAGCPAMNCHGGDQMDHQLTKTGLYSIVISDYSLTKTGTYNVSLTKIPSAIRPGLYNPSPPVGSPASGCYSELSWDAVDGATGYDVYFRTDVTQAATMIANNISSSSTAMPQVQGDQICYWAVIARTPSGDILGPLWWYTTLPCPQIGGLQVTLGPAGAVTAGAQWNVDGGAWQNSGDTITDMPAGWHTVNYKSITGWTAPSDEQVTINGGQTNSISREYTQQQQQTGGLQVTLGPAGAISGGAQWNVDGGTWQNSTVTVSGLTTGSHTVNYKSITGWDAPISEQFTITNGQTNSISRDYIQQIEVCSNPSIIFSDNFDSYTDGADLSDSSYGGWVGRWGGNITASNEESVSSPRSAKMDNNLGCWESQLYHSLPYYPVVWFSADIMGIATGRTGCHDFDVLIQLYTDEGGTWGNNLVGVVLKSGTGQSWEGEGLVAFTSDCSGGVSHSVTLEPDYQGIVGSWINVIVRLDAENHQADFWVDGIHRAALAVDPLCPLYKGIAIDCGEGMGYVDNIQVFTCSDSQQTGGLQVTLGPVDAVSGGAQWNVDGGTWQNSTVTVSGITTGSHTVNYKSITGWDAPISEQVTITNGQTNSISRSYTQQTGGLQVTLAPAEAVTAGAQWNVDSGAWQNSTVTVSGLTTGSHTVNYKSITGWDAPISEQVTITNGQTTSISRNYTQQTSNFCKFGSGNGEKNVKLTLKDCNNNDVTFSLTSGGYGEINCDDCTFKTITLFNATDKSILSIKTKSNVGTSVGSIICNGPLKGISAKTIDVTGNIEIGSPAIPNPKAAVTITIDQAEGLTIKSDIPIKTLTATEWVGGSMDAPSIGSITTKGDKKRIITGDLDIDVAVGGIINSIKVGGELSGTWDCNIVKSITSSCIDSLNLTLSREPNVKIPALGKLTAKWLDYSSILSRGNIGTITVGGMEYSSCFAGVTATIDAEGAGGLPDDVLDLPDPNADAGQINYNDPATIKSITIKGVKTVPPEPFFVYNSNIAAAQILSVSLSYPENNNGGTPFGLSAGFIKSLKIKDAQGTVSFKNLDKPTDSKTFGDAQIRLY